MRTSSDCIEGINYQERASRGTNDFQQSLCLHFKSIFFFQINQSQDWLHRACRSLSLSGDIYHGRGAARLHPADNGNYLSVLSATSNLITASVRFSAVMIHSYKTEAKQCQLFIRENHFSTTYIYQAAGRVKYFPSKNWSCYLYLIITLATPGLVLSGCRWQMTFEKGFQNRK